MPMWERSWPRCFTPEAWAPWPGRAYQGARVQLEARATKGAPVAFKLGIDGLDDVPGDGARGLPQAFVWRNGASCQRERGRRAELKEVEDQFLKGRLGLGVIDAPGAASKIGQHKNVLSWPGVRKWFDRRGLGVLLNGRLIAVRCAWLIKGAAHQPNPNDRITDLEEQRLQDHARDFRRALGAPFKQQEPSLRGQVPRLQPFEAFCREEARHGGFQPGGQFGQFGAGLLALGPLRSRRSSPGREISAALGARWQNATWVRKRPGRPPRGEALPG